MSLTASFPSDRTFFAENYDSVLLDTTVKAPASASFIPLCLKTCLLKDAKFSEA